MQNNTWSLCCILELVEHAKGFIHISYSTSFLSSCVQILMRYWQPVSGAPCLWSVRNAPWSIWFPLLCFSLHFLCWAIIFSILMIFDYPELLGIKQVTTSASESYA